METGAIVCLVISLVIFLILLAVIIAVVVIVTLPPHVKIDSYTAETLNDYGNEHHTYSRLVTISPYEFWSEEAFDATTYFSRIFSDDDDNVVSLCNHIGDHESCYKLLASNTGSYILPRAMSKVESKVSCPKLPDPILAGSKKRTLTTCDVYEYSDSTFYRKDIIEHDTEYPVTITQTSYDEGGNVEYTSIISYSSFDPATPTNRTGLKPPPDTEVFDFRTGYTSSSNVFSRIAEWFGNLFSQKSVKLNPTVEAAMFRFKREQLFREKTGLLSFSQYSGLGIGSTPASVKSRRDVVIPDSFDARKNWDYCSDVIGTITNQLTCGSCWAMSTAAVLSDRACINNISSISYSPQYMMSCYPHQLSCNGGYVGTVWLDVQSYGSVPEECYPFVAKDTACPKKCENGTDITDDMLLKTKRFYSPWAKSASDRVKAIQTEIMEHGPVVTAMLVFSSFRYTTDNVYHRMASEKYSGGHMVRIIGWGSDYGEDYWLVANSWGYDWGMDGFFKIRRGTNECNIENAVVAGFFE